MIEIVQDVLAAQLAGQDSHRRMITQQQNDGTAEQTASALRALIYVGDARARTDPRLGAALREDRTANLLDRLEQLADQLAPRQNWDPNQRPDGPTQALRAHAEQLFDTLTPQAVTRAVADILPMNNYPFDRKATFPLVLAPRELRSVRTLQISLQNRMTRLVQEPELAASGVVMAVATIDHVLGARRGGDAAAQAASVVAVDPRPAYTAARLIQFANSLAADVGNNGQMASQVFGEFGQEGKSLPDHLVAVAQNINRILSEPAGVTRPRASNLFGRDGITPVDNAVVEAVEKAVAGELRASAAPSADPELPRSLAQPADKKSPEAEPAPEPVERIDFGPDLEPEYALLGSLLHAPKALSTLDFLSWKDMPDPDTQAIYQTLRGLHQSGSLYDLEDLPEAERTEAASENHVKLYKALREKVHTDHTVADPARIVARMNEAAPATALPFDGLYNPNAQTQLGLKILEESVLRQLSGMGVALTRDTPAVPLPSATANRTEAALKERVANLERINAKIENLSGRLATATKRTGLEHVASTPAAQQEAQVIAEDAKPERRGLVSDSLRRFTAPLQHRAERHILHLALHAGKLDTIPDEILSLDPDHFTDTRHANMWKAIKELHQRGGEYVNYASLRLEARKPDFAHGPILSRVDLARMADRPQVKPEKIARSLRLLVNSALDRATTDTRNAVKAVASHHGLDVGAALGQAAADIGTLKTGATAALQRHQHLTHATAVAQGKVAR